jgi:polyisoprenoid-binding protein YceI
MRCLRRWLPNLPRVPTRRAAAAAAAVAIVTAAAAAAAPRCYTIDAARSEVEFRIRVFGLFSPGGHFGRMAGSVVFDPEHWETLAVVVRIPVDGLESRPRFWREELLGARFFDRANYPTIAFAATHAERTGPASGIAYGSLTLRGITRPIVLRARLAPAPDALEIDADTSVRRSEFGLGGVLPLASEEVAVGMHLRATPGGCGD